MELERPTCTRRLEWDAAHRVLNHESKCASLHGHRYVAEITCAADVLDGVSRVIDFSVVKQRVGSWIDDFWDHACLANPQDKALIAWCLDHSQRGVYAMPDGEPTAENMAQHLLMIAQQLLSGTGVQVVKVRIWETPNCYADAVRVEGT